MRTFALLLLLSLIDNSTGQGPVFTYPDPSGSTTVSLDEGVPINTVVLTISTTAPATYTFVSVMDPTPATPVDKSGDLTLSTDTIRTAVVLNYEDTPSYTITVEATDGTGTKNRATFVLQVNDLIDEDPALTAGSQQVDFDEEQPAFTPVPFALTVTDYDAGDTHTYSLSGSYTPLFTIDPNSGQILVTQKLDRDAAGATTVFDPLTVTVTDSGGRTGTIDLKVTLIDINDNVPVCTPGLVTASVAENTGAGHLLATLACNDIDDSTNGDIAAYTIFSGDDPTPNAKFTTNGAQIETTASTLDYETKTQYTLVIHITDNGASPQTGSATVIVEVTGENENDPVWGTFTPAGPAYTIPESAGLGTSVLTVTASDQDDGKDGEVEYILVSTTVAGSGTPVTGIFSLDTSSGQLATISSLDRDPPSGVAAYDVVVRAQDKGTTARSVETTLTINIGDDNDNVPVLNPSAYTQTIQESAAKAGASVTQVTASDADQDGTGTLRYQIANGDPNSKFRIRSSGKLELNSDIEIDSPAMDDFYYVLIIEVSDKGVPAAPDRTGTGTVTVSIISENNNFPVFANPVPSASPNIAEDVPIGTTVVTVSATDKDIDDGVPQTVTYAIKSGNTNNDFNIDSVTGVVTTANTLDFETSPTSYTLQITATDNGNTPKSSDVTVTITLTNTNENAPACTAYNVIADMEEEKLGTVTTISCSDSDAGDTVSFSIVPIHPSFTVDANTGEVSTVQRLDYETATTETITVEVKDSLPTRKTSTVTLTVRVQPVNEFPPVFAPVTYNKVIAEDVPTGTSVVTVTATDSDKGALDGTIRYSIVAGNGPGAFTIDSVTGEITTTIIGLDRENAASHTLTVRASDDTPGATTEKTADATVLITVQDANDNTPLCTPLNYQASIVEPSVVGAKVVTLTSTDDDEAGTPNATPDYVITGGDPSGVFTMSGADVTLAQVVDYDTATTTAYTLTVRVTDRGTTPLTSTCVVDVTIVAANESPPVTSVPNVSKTLSETTAIGTTVYDADSTDPDKDTGSTISYSITSGNTNDDFFCYPTTGVIVVWKRLDYDTPPQTYNLTVTSTDDGGLTASMWLHLTLTDENDQTPVFTKNVYSVTVKENVAIGTQVAAVSAKDTDTALAGVVTYTAVSGNGMTVFEVNPGTGAITTIATVDRELRDSYSLVVEAKDSGTPSLSSTVLVDISISDENDNPPRFTPDDFTVNIQEDAVVGTSVTTVFAADADSSASNNVFSYVLADNKFAVDSTTGEVTLTGSLDRETKAIHVLKVLAPDSGAPPQTGTATVTVIVDDINDKTPTIVGSYNPSVGEDAAIGTIVTTITASDDDTGDNARLTYTIPSGNTDGDFRIDADSGIIQVQNPLDRERTNEYQLVVHVADNGIPRRTATTTVTVTITDINDNRPVWASPSYAFHVSENVAAGFSVGTVTATDRDFGLNKALTYKVALFWTGNSAHFNLDPATGVITTATSLDREITPQYVALLRVTDNGTPKLSAEVNVTIAIDDLNDNEPIFLPIAYSATTIENEPVGTGIVTVTVTDADIGINQQITLSIDTSTAAGVRADTFLEVTSGTGVIAVKKVIDRETDASFTFTVLAVDGGFPAHTSSADVTIVVTDQNDNAPVFTQTYYNTEIAYSGQCTKSIVTVSATDADSGTNGEVSYYMVQSSNDHLFSVDSVSGVFSLQSGATAGSMYILQVSARDGGTPTQTAATPAKIRVDAMIPDNVIVTFKLGISVAALLAQEAAFLAECQVLVRQKYPTAVARLWCAETNSDGLADAHVYFLSDDSTESVANSNAAKYYVPTAEARSYFTTDPNGTPSSALSGSQWSPFDVRSVHPYAEPQEEWAQTAEGIAIITFSCILGTALLASAIYMSIRYCRQQKRAKPPKKRLRGPERRPPKKSVQPSPPPASPPPSFTSAKGNPPRPMMNNEGGFFWNRSATQFS